MAVFDLATFGIGFSNIVAIVISIVVIGGIIFGLSFVYKNRFQRYNQFTCVIWQKDGFGQLVEKIDKGGIFIDRDTKAKRLFLKKMNVDLDPDNIPYIPTRGGFGQPNKKVYLLQSGLKNFRYIKPNIDSQHFSFTVGEEDVNWAINTYDKGKKMFAQSWLMQYLPFMLLAFVSMVILILFIYLFKQFGTIGGLIKEIQTLAQYVAAAKSGTIIG